MQSIEMEPSAAPRKETFGDAPRKELQQVDAAACIPAFCHELHNPLQAMVGYASVALSGALGPLNERQQSAWESVQASSRELTAAIEAFQSLFRAASGRTALHFESIEIDELLAPARAELDRAEKNHSLRRLSASRLAPGSGIATDSEHLTPVIAQLTAYFLACLDRGDSLEESVLFGAHGVTWRVRGGAGLALDAPDYEHAPGVERDFRWVLATNWLRLCGGEATFRRTSRSQFEMTVRLPAAPPGGRNPQ